MLSLPGFVIFIINPGLLNSPFYYVLQMYNLNSDISHLKTVIMMKHILIFFCIWYVFVNRFLSVSACCSAQRTAAQSKRPVVISVWSDVRLPIKGTVWAGLVGNRVTCRIVSLAFRLSTSGGQESQKRASPLTPHITSDWIMLIFYATCHLF